MHHRLTPTDHRFTYPVTQIWIDPDDPGALFDLHPLWSASRPAPVRFRRSDYLDGGRGPLGAAIRRELAAGLGGAPDGPLRTLTQPRTWGWLFNPITIHLAWGDPAAAPEAALLEVTNTPWKERHCYPLALDGEPETSACRATFAKALHVSPFLGERFVYQFRVTAAPPRSATDTPAGDGTGARGPGPAPPVRKDTPHDDWRRLSVELDVTAPGRIQRGRGDEVIEEPSTDERVLVTRLTVDRHPAERPVLTHALRHNLFPTHRVSLGIHRQALRLWRLGVPFVPHPSRSGPRRPTSGIR